MIDEQRFEALSQAVEEILRKQKNLEARLARLENASQPGAVDTRPIEKTVVSKPFAGEVKPEDVVHVVAETAAPQVARTDRPAIETKVGLTLVNRIGVITLILGVAFFFKWAVDNEWIGPTGRVLLGVLAGLSAVAAADLLFRKSQRTFAQGIAGAGIAILYLAVYSSFGFYHLVPLAVAFVFLVTTTALAFALSLRFDASAIAALGLLGGYLTPVMLSTGDDYPWFLLSYVLVLDVAAMGLLKRRGWHLLEVLSFVATLVIYVVWFFQGESAHRATFVATLAALGYYTLFGYAGSGPIAIAANSVAALEIALVWQDATASFFFFELLIAGAGMFSAGVRKRPTALSAAFGAFWLAFALFLLASGNAGVLARFGGITLAFFLFFALTAALRFSASDSIVFASSSLGIMAANGCVYYAFAYVLLRSLYHEWLGFLAVCVAGVYIVVAALIRRQLSVRHDSDHRSLLLPLGMATAFVTLAIPIQLSGFRITVAWAIQAAALTWIGARFASNRAYHAGALILAFVAVRLAILDGWLYAFTPNVPPAFLNPRFLAFAVSAVSGFTAAKWAASSMRQLPRFEYLGAHAALLAGLTLEVLLWVSHNTTISNRLSAQTFSISVLYGIYAVVFVSIGVLSRTAVNRFSGLALFGFVIAKLYLFDVWQLDRVYRIAAFVALGILLISTSFLYSRYRHLIEALLRKDEAAS